MANSAAVQALLDKYVAHFDKKENALQGSPQSQEIRKKLAALQVATIEELRVKASDILKNGTSNCPGGWVQCRDGSCAPTMNEC